MAINLSKQKIIKINDEYEYRLIQCDQEYNDKFKIVIPCELSDISSTLQKFETITQISIYESDGTTLIRTTNQYDTRENVRYIDWAYRDENDNIINAIEITLKETSIKNTVKKLEEAVFPSIDYSTMTVDGYRELVIDELKQKCTENIYNGVTVETSYGTESFSATAEDQANIKSLYDTVVSSMSMGQTISLPYHSNGKQCQIYTGYEIISIYCAIQKLILTETSRCNAILTYARQLNDKTALSKLEYGQELPEAITEQMETAINQGLAVIDSLYSTLSSNAENR